MARYTITIEADGESRGAMTTILLETSSGVPRVLEYRVTAGSGGDIAALSYPQVRMDVLIEAFTDVPAAPGAGEQPTGSEGRPVQAATRRATAVRTARPRRGVEEATERTYRRMPDAAELIGAYREAVSVVKLAQQYGVPRHTMNGWLGRLRRKGLIERR